ncbi:MAG: hypothetical protein WA484_04495 [Solirubrobacteraceae bacterium]
MAYVYFQQGKRLVLQRREREAQEKAKRRENKARKNEQSGDRQ